MNGARKQFQKAIEHLEPFQPNALGLNVSKLIWDMRIYFSVFDEWNGTEPLVFNQNHPQVEFGIAVSMKDIGSAGKVTERIETPRPFKFRPKCPRCGLGQERWTDAASGYRSGAVIICCQGCAEGRACLCRT